MILPGETIGVLGGGQLGRMFAMAAMTMGYRVVVLDPDPDSPAGRIADVHIRKPYDDPDALEHMSQLCRAVTTEFENVPAQTMAYLEEKILVRPSSGAVAIAQDRRKEKRFCENNGIPTNRFSVIDQEDDIASGIRHVGLPAILKRAQLGYDGKGQYPVNSEEDALKAFRTMNAVPCVLEEKLDFFCEISVVLARGHDKKVVFYPPAENRHENGILSMSIIPARVEPDISRNACVIAGTMAAHLDYCGVLAVEMFVMPDGRVLVNEMAPRPHNSGHYTIDACVTSQFQQQVRALCGIPLGDTRLLSPAVMLNLLGDIWNPNPAWLAMLQHPNVKLHVYGKKEPRKGRKMGHLTALHENLTEAIDMAEQIKQQLR